MPRQLVTRMLAHANTEAFREWTTTKLEAESRMDD